MRKLVPEHCSEGNTVPNDELALDGYILHINDPFGVPLFHGCLRHAHKIKRNRTIGLFPADLEQQCARRVCAFTNNSSWRASNQPTAFVSNDKKRFDWIICPL